MITLTDAARDALLDAVHQFARLRQEAGYWNGRQMPQAAKACHDASAKHLDSILDTLLPEEDE